MTYPKVTIEEILDGAPPIPNLGSFSRVGSVGLSKRGSYNKFVLGSTFTDLTNKIGKTLDTGSVGLQCAIDEGATDWGHVRVMGAARQATATFNLSGTGSLSGAVAATDYIGFNGTVTAGDILTIKVNSTAYSHTATGADTIRLIEQALVAAITADAAAVVSAAEDMTNGSYLAGLKLTSKNAGTPGNAITVVVSASPAWVPAFGTVTIGGTPLAGNTATITIGGTAVTYTVTSTDMSAGIPLYSIATNAAAALVANSTINTGFKITVNNAEITITEKIDGMVGDSVTLTATTAQGTAGSDSLTATASGADLAGASGSTETLVELNGTGLLAGGTGGTGNITLSTTLNTVTKTYTTAVTQGATALQIATALVNLVNADGTSQVVTILDGSVPGNVILSARLAGNAGNSIQYNVSESPTPDGITMTSAAGNLVGGFDGPVAGFAVSNDLKLVAAWEGESNITYTYVPGVQTGTVDLTVTDNDTLVSETWLLSFTAADLINGTELAVLRQSNLVRGFFTGSLASPVLPTGTGNLAGSSIGSTVSDTDYISALTVLGSNKADIIMAPGQTSSSVLAALLAQAENATIITGLRIAVLNGPRLCNATTAPTAATGYNTTTGSAVMVVGWCTYASQPQLAELSVSPDGFYAGHVAATPIHVSPAARTSSPYFKTVSAVDTTSDDVNFEAYTDGRLEAIILDPATGGFHCLNGRTLASDTAEYYICVRRQANKMKTEIFFAAQALKSEPKNGTLAQDLGNFIPAYLIGQRNSGFINDFKQIGVTSTTQGLREDFEWSPVYPADDIDFGMHRLSIPV